MLQGTPLLLQGIKASFWPLINSRSFLCLPISLISFFVLNLKYKTNPLAVLVKLCNILLVWLCFSLHACTCISLSVLCIVNLLKFHIHLQYHLSMQYYQNHSCEFLITLFPHYATKFCISSTGLWPQMNLVLNT